MDLLPLLLIFAVMLVPLLFMSSRQRKAQREQQERVSRLGVGDEVRTHSGFYGLIVDQFDDVVILESENGAQTKWARQAIAGPADPTALTEEPGTEDAAEQPEDASATSSADTDFSADGEVPGVTARDTDPDTRRDA